MTNWGTIWAALVGSGIGSLMWPNLFPKIFGHLLDKRLENYKAQLKAASDTELERIRAALRSFAFANETRFGWYYKAKAEAIASIYAKVADVQTATALLAEAASKGQTTDELQANVRNVSDQCFAHFNRYQLYLDIDVRWKLRTFMQSSVDAASLLRGTSSLQDPKFQQWLKCQETIDKRLEEIEASFHRALGMNAKETSGE